MFSLIVLFFAKMVHKQEWEERGNYFLGSWVALNLFLLLGLMGWIVPSTKHHFKHDVINDPNMARACVAALLFFVLSMLLIKYGLTLARMITDSRVQLLATELTGLQIRTLTIVLSSLFTLRSTFNVLAAATGKFSLRMAGETNQEAVLLFLMVVAWELVPIFAVTFFFRHIPNPNQPRGGNNRSDRGPLLPPNMSIPNYTPGLFQNPNHYDNPTLPFDESRTMGRGITALPALDNARFVVPSPRNSGSPRQQNFRFATQTVQGSHPPRVPSPSEGMMTSPTRNTAYRFSSNTRDSPTYPRLSNDPSATILPAQPS
ncbi:hypothetical protein SARC_03182 [Sphaeroforma arctica JP610]|uniref:THH1/TOM1/TOM3 domain-containing protein n=1 Tax=Sphaeroforma arctica JP610 TaxID=667725 RepID=A0A0L0G6H9_9EUKA|nr:hypothetical protein SARC_03182 [Sphaeroforma arctica JP610]KNC84615.1 hypothetical protein SARC_03182 [Sphaeroforma arctica JP610]|eukprot:XP_014158517.1 hypothetical protein SARC_03182 [Sphaeroforma arctica JP610]